MRSGRSVSDRTIFSPSAVPTETFTVIHAGVDSDGSSKPDLVETLRAWTLAAGSRESRVVEVWGAAWRHLFSGCMATAVAGGGPAFVVPVPNADEFVADLRACGVAVRYRLVRQATVDDAELRAVSQGRPIRYL